MSLSLVVVTWECAHHLDRLVESLNRNLDPGVELIVVDNDSKDDPAAVTGRWQGRTRFERLGSNRGFGAAANVGVTLASSEAIVLLNPDTQLLDDRLADLATYALRHRCLAGPRLLNPDGSVQPSASGVPVGVWPWVGALVPGAVQPAFFRARTEPWRATSRLAVAWLSGACLAGPRSLLLLLGPFDPAIHLYAEDMDLCLRAGEAGVVTWFCPELTRVAHRRRASSERRWPDGPEELAAANRRAVLRRAYGNAREHRAWWAQRSNLWLRAHAKRLLGRNAGSELRELRAISRAS